MILISVYETLTIFNTSRTCLRNFLIETLSTLLGISRKYEEMFLRYYTQSVYVAGSRYQLLHAVMFYVNGQIIVHYNNKIVYHIIIVQSVVLWVYRENI